MADSQEAAKPKPITITKISFGMTVNIENFENVRFDLTAQVLPDEDWRDVFASLQRKSDKIKQKIKHDYTG